MHSSQDALQRHEFFRDCLAAQRISLKMASQVMLLRNLELTGGANKMLVNGSRGVIAYFLSREEARTKLLAEIKEARVSRCACLPEVHGLTPCCDAGQEQPGGPGRELASAPPVRTPIMTAAPRMRALTCAQCSSNLDAAGHAMVPVVSFMNGVRGACCSVCCTARSGADAFFSCRAHHLSRVVRARGAWHGRLQAHPDAAQGALAPLR